MSKHIKIGDTVKHTRYDGVLRSGVVTSVDGNRIWATFDGIGSSATFVERNKIHTVIKKNEWKGGER